MKILLFISILMASCNRDPLPKPCDNPECDTNIVKKDSIFSLLWQKALRMDSGYTVSHSQFIAGNFVVFRYDEDEQEKQLFINKMDTTSTRFLNPNNTGYLNVFYHPVVGVIAIDYKSVFIGIDASSMKKVATVPPGMQFRASYTLYEDYVYGVLRDDTQKQTIVFKMNVYTGDITTDKIVKDTECLNCENIILDTPTFFTSQSGDKLIIYNTLFVIESLTTYKSKVEVYKLNDSNKELLWTSDVSAKGGLWIKKDESVLKVTPDSIFSMNPNTGDVYWSNATVTKHYGWGLYSDTIIDEHIYCLENGHILAINVNNGNVDFDSGVLFSPQSNSRYVYFDGVLYFTADDEYSYIYGFRTADKKVVLKMRSPNHGKAPYYNDTNFGRRVLSIDPATRLAYTHDGFFAQCFRIPVSYE